LKTSAQATIIISDNDDDGSDYKPYSSAQPASVSVIPDSPPSILFNPIVAQVAEDLAYEEKIYSF
jgi:hypothetical protein